MDLLTNPWVIIVIVLSVVIGNIAALKYTAKMKFGQMEKKNRHKKTLTSPLKITNRTRLNSGFFYLIWSHEIFETILHSSHLKWKISSSGSASNQSPPHFGHLRCFQSLGFCHHTILIIICWYFGQMLYTAS